MQHRIYRNFKSADFFWRFVVTLLLSIAVWVHAAEAEWATSSDIDPMTDVSQHFAHSPRVQAKTPLSFPYHDLSVSVHYACDSTGSDWAYLAFSVDPNSPDVEPTTSGYSMVTVRLRWDDTLIRHRLRQEFGSRFLHFQMRGANITKPLKESRRLLVEINIYGSGPTVFEIPLTGSAVAMESVRNQCGLPPFRF